MKQATFKNCEFLFHPEKENKLIVKQKCSAQAAGHTEPLCQLRSNVRMLPILPKKKSNPIRAKQLDLLREKENKILAFYFYQRANSQKDDAMRRKILENKISRNELYSEKCSPKKSSRPINHYSFLQMKERICDKTKYTNQKSWEGFKGKKVVLE